MRKLAIFSAIVVLLPCILFGAGAPPERIPEDPGEYIFHIMPFERRNAMGGQVTFIPRFYYFVDGEQYRKNLDIAKIEYKLGDETLYYSDSDPFHFKADFTFRDNGEIPFTVTAFDIDGNEYSFQTNIIISNVNVIVRANLKEPLDEDWKLYLAGSASVLLRNIEEEKWSPRALEMTKIDDTVYEASFKMGLAESLQMEFTLGSWGLKARRANGAVHRETVRRIEEPNQLVVADLDNFGKTVGRITAEGFVLGFEGDGSEFFINYTQRGTNNAALHYAYGDGDFKTIESEATQFCRFAIPARWGEELNFFFTPQRRVITNTMTLLNREYPFMFLMLGDTHGNAQMPNLIGRNEKPHFLIHTGDMVHEGLESSDWNGFFNVHRGILHNMPFQPVAGNHEYVSPFYNAVTGRPYYYGFSFLNTYFIALDSNVPFEKGSRQYRWLESELKKAKNYKFRIVYFHDPMYSTRHHESNPYIREAWEHLFIKYGVHLVFSGHDHGYQATYPVRNEKIQDNGTVYIVAGGGGGRFYDITSNPEWRRFEKTTLHYLRVTVDRASIFIEAIDDNGEIFDTYTIR